MDWRNKIKSVVDEINWIPSWGRDREHDWLDNMGDWMISKKRFWGLALPIWTFEDGTFHVVAAAVLFDRGGALWARLPPRREQGPQAGLLSAEAGAEEGGVERGLALHEEVEVEDRVADHKDAWDGDARPAGQGGQARVGGQHGGTPSCGVHQRRRRWTNYNLGEGNAQAVQRRRRRRRQQRRVGGGGAGCG